MEKQHKLKRAFEITDTKMIGTVILISGSKYCETRLLFINGYWNTILTLFVGYTIRYYMEGNAVHKHFSVG